MKIKTIAMIAVSCGFCMSSEGMNNEKNDEFVIVNGRRISITGGNFNQNRQRTNAHQNPNNAQPQINDADQNADNAANVAVEDENNNDDQPQINDADQNADNAANVAVEDENNNDAQPAKDNLNSKTKARKTGKDKKGIWVRIPCAGFWKKKWMTVKQWEKWKKAHSKSKQVEDTSLSKNNSSDSDYDNNNSDHDNSNGHGSDHDNNNSDHDNNNGHGDDDGAPMIEA